MARKRTDTAKTAKPQKSAKVRLGTATLVALSGFGAYHGVQAIAATATLPIIARLIRAVDLTINTTLDFGTLAMTVDRAGQATVDPALNHLFIDDNSSLSLAGGKPAAGRLQVRGVEYPVAISIAEQTVKLTNGTDSVLVDDFNLVTLNGGIKMTFTPTQGTASFTVPIGATINTRPGQVSGTYVGVNRIFASYQ